MACRVVRFTGRDGVVHTAIACGPGPKRHKCAFCDCPDAKTLCDWPIGDGKTCDKPCCYRHRRHVGDDRDYCMEHWDAQTTLCDDIPPRHARPPAAAQQRRLFE